MDTAKKVDRHKVWLVVSIIFVVLAVSFLVFFPKQALVGKAGEQLVLPLAPEIAEPTYLCYRDVEVSRNFAVGNTKDASPCAARIMEKHSKIPDEVASRWCLGVYRGVPILGTNVDGEGVKHDDKLFLREADFYEGKLIVSLGAFTCELGQDSDKDASTTGFISTDWYEMIRFAEECIDGDPNGFYYSESRCLPQPVARYEFDGDLKDTGCANFKQQGGKQICLPKSEKYVSTYEKISADGKMVGKVAYGKQTSQFLTFPGKIDNYIYFPGKVLKALSSDGSLISLRSYSISFWTRLKEKNNNLFTVTGPKTPLEYGLYSGDSLGIWYKGEAKSGADALPADGRWHFVTVVHDEKQQDEYFFVDGKKVGDLGQAIDPKGAVDAVFVNFGNNQNFDLDKLTIFANPKSDDPPNELSALMTEKQHKLLFDEYKEEYVEFACKDGKDNDNDGLKDCADNDCWQQPYCPKYCETVLKCEKECKLGSNGEYKCADCLSDAQCDTFKGESCVDNKCQQIEQICTDNKDNDVDGKIDCADSDCFGKQNNEGLVCCDKIGTVRGSGEKKIICSKSSGWGNAFYKAAGGSCSDSKCVAGTTCDEKKKTCVLSEGQGCDNDNFCASGFKCVEGRCAKTDVVGGVESCTSNNDCSEGKCIDNKCVQEICTNGIDDDGDGIVDCLDTDCSGKEGPNGLTCCNSGTNDWKKDDEWCDDVSGRCDSDSYFGTYQCYQCLEDEWSCKDTGHEGICKNGMCVVAKSCTEDIDCSSGEYCDQNEFICKKVDLGFSDSDNDGVLDKYEPAACINSNFLSVYTVYDAVTNNKISSAYSKDNTNFIGVFAGCLKGDIGGNNVVDSKDITPFISIYRQFKGSTKIIVSRADLTQNGLVDSKDITPFIAEYRKNKK